MDLMILTWSFQHSLKHSLNALTKVIPKSFTNLNCKTDLRAFIAYATCKKMYSTGSCISIREWKMCHFALVTFVKEVPAIFRHKNYNELLKFCHLLKLLVTIQNLLNSEETNKIYQRTILMLKEFIETYEEELPICLAKNPLPWSIEFEEMKDKVMNEGTDSKDVYLDLISKLSRHVRPLLEVCTKTMLSNLPSSGIELINGVPMKRTVLKQGDLLPSNSMERFHCLTTMIKDDSSEEGLLSMVKLILRSPREGSSEALVHCQKEVQNFSDVFGQGSEIVNEYNKRLSVCKEMLSGMGPSNKRGRRDRDSDDERALATTSCDQRAVEGMCSNGEEMEYGETSVCVGEGTSRGNSVAHGIDSEPSNMPCESEKIIVAQKDDNTPTEQLQRMPSVRESKVMLYRCDDIIKSEEGTEESEFFTCESEEALDT